MKEHKISLSTATLLTMNILIGSGILIGPGKIAAIAGNASFLAWPIVAMLFLPLVLSAAQLSNMFPGCGGFYSYAKEGLNKNAGFISGWLYIVGYTFAFCVDVLAIRETFVATGYQNWLTLNPLMFNFVFIAICAILNLMSLKFIGRVLNSLTITKILPLIILIILLPFVFNSSFTITSTELFALPNSLPLAIFGFFGFEYCCSLTHLIENSKRNAPKAIFFGFTITALLYTLFHFGALNVMSAQGLAQYGASSYAQFINLPIPFLKTFLMFLIPVASILTIFAGANGMLNANAIMLQSMASEKLFVFWPWLTKLNRVSRPYVAVLLLSLISLFITATLTDIPTVGNLCNLGVFLSFVLPFISLLLIQVRKGVYSKVPLTFVSLLISFGFIVYSWVQIADNNTARLYAILPLIVTFVVGYALYWIANRK